ncbi:MAG: HpcH/HpaI aldolase/citrate lyase family protein [Asticcacaulis sp.]
MTPTFVRTLLFVPADKPRAVQKAAGLSPDLLVFDLEDAVAPDAKPGARLSLIEALQSLSFQAAIGIRLNGVGTAAYGEDLEALSRLSPPHKPALIVLPKLESVAELERARHDLDRVCPGQSGGGRPIWGLIETPLGVTRLDALGEASRTLGLRGLIAGTNDLARTLRCKPGADRAPLHYALSRIVLTARAFGLCALDGVYNAFQDTDGFLAECQQGRTLGFDGKSLIHPAQIDPATAVFSPDANELSWARAVVAAFDDPGNARSGAIALNGEMVERLHLETARLWLQQAQTRPS